MSKLLNNRYNVLRTIGEGAFGKTFLAEDTNLPSNPHCVVKQLKLAPHKPDAYEIIIERFEREADILYKLGKSNEQIPSLYASFPENQEFYLVQEWIDGKNLAQKYQADGVLSENTVCRLLLSLLSVLEYIHGQNIIHRDIKPENIMLRESDGKPVLIDFGSIKEIVGSTLDSQGNPDNTIIIGTPGFMAAEQAVGQPVFASDLYSLGMTALFLLTGKRPRDLMDSLRRGIRWQQYANVSAEFGDVLDKAIQQSLDNRYQTAKEMSADIMRVPRSEKIVIPIPPPDPDPEPTPPVPLPTPRPKFLYWIVGTIVLAVLVGALFTFKGVFGYPGPKPPIKSSCYLYNDDSTQKTVNVRSGCDTKDCDDDPSTIVGEYENETLVRVNREVTVKSRKKGFDWVQIVLVETGQTAWVASSKFRCQ